jgi:hypothetical protein
MTYEISDLPPALAVRISVDEAAGCWRMVLATHDRYGYAKVGRQLAHRLVYRLLVGEIPPERPHLDHVKKRGCEHRDCVWPAHLEPVTPRVNTLRGTSFAAVNAAKDRCDNGHEYDLLNTYYKPDGHRDCRACIRDRVRRYSQRKLLRLAAYDPALAEVA